MYKYIAAIAFILIVFGLIVLNRFDFSPKVSVVVHRDTGTSYSIGHTFARGETIQTGKGEYLELYIGGMVVVNLDENTRLNLKSLSKSHIRVQFNHGRILTYVNENDGGNLEVDTPSAQFDLTGVVATFIGYDFKSETDAVLLFIVDTYGNMHATIPKLNQSFDVISPILIHDTQQPSIEQMKFDEKANARKEFYDWTKVK